MLIGQLVKLVRDGEELRLSKRAGTIVTLDDFVDLVGVDAGRYSLARWSADTPLTLDIAEITRRSNDNPVYYVQYAHARTNNVARNAADVGIGLDVFRPELLTSPYEASLLTALGEFPRVVATRGRAARAAPGRALPRGSRERLSPLVRRVPHHPDRATTRSPTSTAPARGSTRRPASCSRTGSNCSA